MEARAFLGTSPAEELEWEADLLTPEGEIDLEYVSEKLDELRVRIQHKKPGTGQ